MSTPQEVAHEEMENHDVEEGAVIRSGSPGRVVVLNGEPFTARVKRPVHSIREPRTSHEEVPVEQQQQLEEVVRVRLTLRRRQFYHMNLFLNLPSASAATPIASTPHFASAFNHTPLISPGELEEELHTTLFSFGISDIVSQLGLSLHPYLLLTFVPTGRFKDAPVTINAITIDLE
ncbi:hypothetical protein L7F22_044786 [Adiantum nelumboides]|nr:hypothetical protein [Adiantum nelumboides]